MKTFYVFIYICMGTGIQQAINMKLFLLLQTPTKTPNHTISKLIHHETVCFFCFMKLKDKPSKQFSGNIFS